MRARRVLHQYSMHLANRATALYQGVRAAPRRWRQPQVLDAQEAERLDRVRNPSKYLGKSQEQMH